MVFLEEGLITPFHIHEENRTLEISVSTTKMHRNPQLGNGTTVDNRMVSFLHFESIKVLAYYDSCLKITGRCTQQPIVRHSG